MEEIKRGRYRHFKGKEYEVIGFAVHSETGEKLVVYKALYGDHAVWVRPVAMWNEKVVRDGKEYTRFTYLGGTAEPPKPGTAVGRNKIAARMAELEKVIGYKFKRRRWLADAMNMTVVSPPSDKTPEYANENLALVGDTVLKLVLAEKMYCENTSVAKKEITERKIQLENNRTMKRVVDKYRIHTYSFNEKYFYTNAPAHHKIPNPAHTPFIESIIGAVYFDSSFQKTRQWILDWLLPELEEAAAGNTPGNNGS